MNTVPGQQPYPLFSWLIPKELINIHKSMISIGTKDRASTLALWRSIRITKGNCSFCQFGFALSWHMHIHMKKVFNVNTLKNVWFILASHTDIYIAIRTNERPVMQCSKYNLLLCCTRGMWRGCLLLSIIAFSFNLTLSTIGFSESCLLPPLVFLSIRFSTHHTQNQKKGVGHHSVKKNAALCCTHQRIVCCRSSQLRSGPDRFLYICAKHLLSVPTLF